MTLTHILIFTIAAPTLSLIFKGRWRGWLLLVVSTVALFWLQPGMPIRQMDFWLPVITLALVVLVWIATRPKQEEPEQRDLRLLLVPLAILISTVLIIGLTRYISPLCCITANRPPDMLLILPVLAAITLLGTGLFFITPKHRWPMVVLIAFLLGLLVIIKTEPLALAASAALRSLMAQSAEQASALDIRWLGISYIAFRLIHVLRDRQIGTLPDLTLDEFACYVLFFPTLTAGPIDRAERFVKDLRAPFSLSAEAAFEGGSRIVTGLFKKFVLADALALFALNGTNATQTTSTGWLWVMLYAYAFRIFFDFAGLSDIAIGLGRLAGFTIPENFDRPYTKPNLTAFWNSWHITLALWFRAYYFNPLSRAMRSKAKALPAWAMIGISQLTTMVLIGLWHGVSWNFAIWGAWHGIGLFIHNRWANFTRAQDKAISARPRLRLAIDIATTLLTFHYVVLGWVWFALPDMGLSWQVLLRLVGIQG
ncbi:MAG: MBOAT family protein [Anaerolineae bacterium]|nr:MBOAT family protein [Anaerolineae bacterium]